ncbi:hypothetical protein [Elioraea sp.]|jgi:hypothetical protein|uniref:hypothetical protein n=1 Tax=Elioraea sp. TaxID=2185103 RepID=UPI003F6F7B9F
MGVLRLILRLLGAVLILAALWPLVRETAMGVSEAGHSFIPLGQLWFEINPASLNMLQAGIQRRISPGLWEGVIQPVLTWPAWPVLIGTGLGLILVGRTRRA